MRILFLLFPDHGDPPELRMERFAGAYYLFKDLLFEVVLASPSAGSPMASLVSSDRKSAAVSRFNTDGNARDELADTIGFDQVVVEDFDAAYSIGLTGPIWTASGPETLIARFLAAGKSVVVIPGIGLDLAECGAGCGMLIIGDQDGSPLLAAHTLSHLLHNSHSTKG